MELRNLFSFFLLVAFTILLSSCGEEKPNASPEYIKEINDWDQRRVENLKRETGWLNLVGLYWLEEGRNTFGADENNDLIFPSNAPGFIGTFTLEDSTVSISVNDDVDVTVGGNPVTNMILRSDMEDSTTVMEYKSLRWFVIQREEKFGIRLRDLEAELVKNFEGIERFTINEDWKIPAEYSVFDEPRTMQVPSIIGTVTDETVYGELKFSVKGSNYSLTPITSGSGYFLVFADETSGEETYGAGRFLYVEGADSTGHTVIDFNKAYNPPCAFTKYATCPLPPKENYLKLRITAGEKNYGEGH
ncbi:MAG: DUF1684 domain-containing protein [Melioribacteraceae bacterium]|nr:DUF1684 domain-containing protein [Melioribacteraceae bacterium]MCF8353845.1 DUF1684 domain-containing protein [Melioribacteraceae bacterium]MCF8393078.1 DUF1684 domain-containing protein [Melioribacteraceae bacterium]MCF8419197.1 DUF1684 domain-containing protein [Melioribacteraceae bacterium]